jgi:membrane associated rhomboid family serine protease
MKKEEIKELIDLKSSKDSIRIIVPLAFGLAGLLMFISFLYGKNDFSWFATVMGILGFAVLIPEIKKRREINKKVKELEKKLEEE